MKTPFAALCFLAVLLLLPSAQAQKLKAFEKDATSSSSKPKKSKNSSKPNEQDNNDTHRVHYHGLDHHHDRNDSFASYLIGGASRTLYFGLIDGWSDAFLHLVPNPSIAEREPGESRTPYVRFDADFQDIDGEVDAIGLLAEIGYGPIALYGRQTKFTEDLPRLEDGTGGGSDSLTARHGHLMARAIYGENWSINLGVGAFQLDGEDSNTGFAFTAPLQYRFGEHAGLEFRPMWSRINGNSIAEYDIALLGGVNHVDLKLGWRTLNSPNLELDGFYGGLSLRW